MQNDRGSKDAAPSKQRGIRAPMAKDMSLRLHRIQSLASAIVASSPINTLLADRFKLDSAIEQLAEAIAEEAETAMLDLEQIEVASRTAASLDS